MKRCATTLFSLLFITFFATSAFAQQDVTVREINTIHPDSIAALNAGGAALTANEIGSLVTPALDDSLVRFTAVVVSDPRNSGLSTPDGDGLPSRVHVFVRDTTANSLGVDGMTVQVVDGAWQTNSTEALLVGDVIEIVGTVSPFFTTMQISPTSIEIQGAYTDFGLPSSILDPVTVTVADINSSVGAGVVQANWDNFAALRGQYVRIESASVAQRSLADPDRPDWLVTDDAGNSLINAYDTSIRYRNQRTEDDQDPDLFNTHEEDFVPPPPGSAINLQGFLTFNNDDPFFVGMPTGGMYKINPMADSDLEITETTPIISDIMRSEAVPTDAFDVTAMIVADPARTITGATLSYFSSSSADTTEVAGTGVDGVYTFPIPALTDGDFVTYFITATDNQGGESTTSDESARFLTSGVASVSHIQETADGGTGISPMAGFDALAMDLTVTIQTDPAIWEFVGAQEDAAGTPWTGIVLDSASVVGGGATIGDVIHITQADVVESGFSLDQVTRLENVVFTVVSSGAPFAPKVITTDAVVDPAIGEAHEGLSVRFENVTIIDDDTGFGECSFSSDGTEDNAIEMDDLAPAFDQDYCPNTFDADNIVEFISGVFWQSFGEHKVIPTSAGDIGTITDIEDEEVPEGFALEQNYPNPFNPSTTIRFAVDQTGPVELQVFDLLGRRVATLVNRELPAGAHTISFDGSQMASGLYLYRLSSGSKTVTKTMTLLK